MGEITKDAYMHGYEEGRVDAWLATAEQLDAMAVRQDPAYKLGWEAAIAVAAQVIDDERGCDRCVEIIRALKP